MRIASAKWTTVAVPYTATGAVKTLSSEAEIASARPSSAVAWLAWPRQTRTKLDARTWTGARPPSGMGRFWRELILGRARAGRCSRRRDRVREAIAYAAGRDVVVAPAGGRPQTPENFDQRTPAQRRPA